MRCDRVSDGVVIQDGNGRLQQDGAAVEILIHEMDGAAGDLHAVGQGLILRIQAGESREAATGGYSGCDWEIAKRTRRSAVACSLPDKPIQPRAFKENQQLASRKLVAIEPRRFDAPQVKPSSRARARPGALGRFEKTNPISHCSFPAQDILGDGFEIRAAARKQNAQSFTNTTTRGLSCGLRTHYLADLVEAARAACFRFLRNERQSSFRRRRAPCRPRG